MPSQVDNPVIHKGFQTFHLNRFSRHAVVYEGSGKQGDHYRIAGGHKLRITADSLFVLIGAEELKASVDSFIYPDEYTTIINKQVWLPVPLNKVYRIKSKRQPLSHLTGQIVVLSYAAFLTGLIVAATSSDPAKQNAWGAVAITGDFTFLAAAPLHIWLARKRFVFKKYSWKYGRRPWVMM